MLTKVTTERRHPVKYNNNLEARLNGNSVPSHRRTQHSAWTLPNWPTGTNCSFSAVLNLSSFDKQKDKSAFDHPLQNEEPASTCGVCKKSAAPTPLLVELCDIWVFACKPLNDWCRRSFSVLTVFISHPRSYHICFVFCSSSTYRSGTVGGGKRPQWASCSLNRWQM